MDHRDDDAIEAGTDGERRRERRVRTDLFVNRFLNGHPYTCAA